MFNILLFTIGRSKVGPPPPLRTNIFLISCSFSENLGNVYAGAHLLEGWRPLLRGIMDPPLFTHSFIYLFILHLALNCGDPLMIANGRRHGDAPFRCRSFVIYSCNDGFELRGSPIKYCVDGQWQTPEPRCIPTSVLSTGTNF